VFIVRVNGEEVFLLNQGSYLVVLCDDNAIHVTGELGVDQEQKACVEGVVLVDPCEVVNFNEAIIVHIGHTACHCKVLCDRGVADFDLGGILNVEDSSLICVVTDYRAIEELGEDHLVVREHYGSSPN
jgi:hypothetical protein